VVKGPVCQLAFGVHGSRGALAWDFERMNELSLNISDGKGAEGGYARIVTGPSIPSTAISNPAPGNSLSYDDLKVIEASRFLKSIVDGRQAEPGFAEALAVARVQAAIERSWASEKWQVVNRVET
jgi:hypothetical protein